MIKSIDGAVFSRMMLSAAAEIDLNKQKVNELNVFPVPDGDTGTNMSMTLSAASTELRKADGITLTKAADKTASALLRGARGNSGVILSLLFRGFSKSLKGKLEADGKDFAAALTAGVEAAYKAVMKPAEGTILTVSRLTADAARDLAAENNEIEYVLQHCLDTAHAALDNTVNQNPVLKKAGVVDAGGMGFCLILRGMLESLRGNDIVCEDAGAVNEEADFGIFDSEDISFAFDTVFIVRKREDITSLDPLREYLGSIGDSLVIGEDDEAFKVHVHTNIPGDALSEAQKYGTLELAKIENMRLQHDDLTAGRKARSTDDLEAVEVGGRHWGFSCKVTCDSPYGYLAPQEFSYEVNGSATVTLHSLSSCNDPYSPIVQIKQSGGQNFSIQNVTDGGRTFTLKGIPTGSGNVLLDSDHGVLTCDSGLNLYPYCNFKFPRLLRGDNQLILTGSGVYTFTCEFPVNVGG